MTKRLLSILLCLLTALLLLPTVALATDPSVWTGVSAPHFKGGTGTEDDPYQIATAEQLCLLSAVINQKNYSIMGSSAEFGDGERVVIESGTAQSYAELSTAYYKLTADIKLNDVTDWESWDSATTGLNNWYPIGLAAAGSQPDLPFKGHFDGDGHTVSGLYSNHSDNTDIKVFGLFGRAQAATISNLTVAQGLSVGYNTVGAVVGYGDVGCTVENCQNSITVKGAFSVGGIAGFLDGGITNCQNSGRVDGNYYIGGIAGSLIGGITNCQNSGRVDGGSDIGAIVGYVGTTDSSTISNCQNSGSVGSNRTSYRAGGVVGGLERGEMGRLDADRDQPGHKLPK